MLPAVAVSLVGLCAGAVIDFRTGRLPNWLTFSMMGLGIAMWSSLGDPLFALKGLAVATAIHFTLFAMSVVRAGDAQLMMGLLVSLAAVRLLLTPFTLGLYVRQRFVLSNVLGLGCEVFRIALLFVLLFAVEVRVLWVVVASVATSPPPKSQR